MNIGPVSIHNCVQPEPPELRELPQSHRGDQLQRGRQRGGVRIGQPRQVRREERREDD